MEYFPQNLEEAGVIQRQLAEQVVTEDRFGTLSLIGGLDVSNNLQEPDKIYTAAVSLERTTLQLREQNGASFLQTFPYIRGFLGFREAPGLIAALKGLTTLPDLLMVDGHGISHPRKLGIASHLGVMLNIPTIGVAKKILVGKPEGSLGSHVGDQIPLMWKGVQIATLVRTKLRCNPVIVSVGHLISLKSAVDIVLNCLSGYKLPEPTRQAHLAANRYRTSLS